MKNLGKKAMMALMATSIVATSVVGLTGCNNTKNNNSAKNVFSMAAVSGASYLQTLNGSATAENDITRPEGMTADKEQALAEYLVMFDDMLANGGFETDTTDPTADELKALGSNIEYKSKIAVTIKGEKYAIYYNETTEDGKDVDPDDDDDEIESTLEGVMVVGEDQFKVSGKREAEKGEDGKPGEVEIEFMTESENGAVEVKQEIEGDEVEYGYTIYEKDAEGELRKVYEYEIEWENEDGKNEMEVEIVDRSSGSKEKVEYKIENESENKYKVSVKEKGSAGKVKNSFTVEKVTDGYKFIYDDNNQIVVNA